MKTLEDIDCVFPATLAEALELQADEKTRGVPIAGGTDLMVQWGSGAVPLPDRAVCVKDLPELTGIAETADAVVIGGVATHMDIRHSSLVRKHAPSLADAAATVGALQIQAQGTIAGSLANASPAGDLAPSLFAFDSSVVVASARGEREIKLTEFFLDYRKIDLRADELIVRIVVPKLPDGHREGFRKLGTRAAQAISKVVAGYRGCANDGTVSAFAVALGSVAPIPIRLREVESWIVGKTVDEKVLVEAEQRASDGVCPIADIRSTAEYRKWVSGRLVRGFLEELAG